MEEVERKVLMERKRWKMGKEGKRSAFVMGSGRG